MDQLFAPFTENAVATQATECDRPSCSSKIIPAGGLRFYVRNLDDKDMPGRWVCKPCYGYYRNPAGRSVTVRPPSGHSHNSQSNGRVDVHSIRRDVNESQRRGGHTNQGRVTPMPPSSSMVAPPTRGSGPILGISASPWANTNPSGQVVNSSWTPAPVAMGYSSAHAQHAQQTREWSQRSYMGILGCSSAQNVSLVIEVYQPEVDSKGNPIRIPQIKEGLQVPYNILNVHLVERIKNVIQLPLLEYAGSVEVDFNLLVVRENTGGMWTRITPDNNHPVQYFQDRFLAPPRKRSDITPTLSIPKKPLIFGITLPADVWTKIQERDELEFYHRQSLGPGQVTNNFSQSHDEAHKRKDDDKTNKKDNGRKKRARKSKSPSLHDPESDSDNSAVTEYIAQPHRSCHRIVPSKTPGPSRATLSWSNQTQATEVPTSRSASQSGTGRDSVGGTIATAIVVKSGSLSGSKSPISTQQTKAPSLGISTSNLMGRKIPLSLPGPQPQSVSRHRLSEKLLTSSTQLSYRPLAPDAIRRGFQEGGASVDKKELMANATPFVSERVIFSPLPELAFEDLIRDPGQAIFISVCPESYFNGTLAYNPTSTLGKGSFKTAIKASLEFDGKRTPLTGLGSVTIDNASAVSVALKRPFVPVHGRGEQSRLRSKAYKAESRLGYADEQYAITGEAKLLVWGNALLNFAYAFILDFVKKSGKEENLRDFIDNMPTFCFVQAGVAIVQKEVQAEKSKLPSSHRATYLLEEMLPGAASDFTKYINNSEAVPLIEHDEPDFDLAVFLTFIQHVQYQITHGQAYVSDFQGVSTTLTDPQIMTSPTLGPSLFGEGNLGEAFEHFPLEHVCNDYCQWFNLDSLNG